MRTLATILGLAYLGLAVVGYGLIVWAARSLPKGTPMRVVPPPFWTKRGPYRWFKHPMYLGNTLLFTGLAGLGGGLIMAITIGSLTELIMREWKDREEDHDPREKDPRDEDAERAADALAAQRHDDALAEPLRACVRPYGGWLRRSRMYEDEA